MAETRCGDCRGLLDLTGWCPTCRAVTLTVTVKDEFVRALDALIERAEARPFRGRRKALTALRQVRRQRGLG